MVDLFKARHPWLNPCTETLYQKYLDLQERLKRFEPPHDHGLKDEQNRVVEICRTYLQKVKDYIEIPLLNTKWPFLHRRHPHLMWQLLHRVDECFVLLCNDEELYSLAIDVKVSFDLNIREEKVRAAWIGDKGVFRDIMEQFEGKDKNNVPADRCRRLISDALKLINEKMDQSYWQLSMNTITSVLSGLFLAVFLLIALIWQPCHSTNSINHIKNLGEGCFADTFVTLIALGLMGAYLSNLMTKENFLYVRGGPFLRCLLHNLFSKPVMSAFAAVFMFGLEKTKLIFSIGAQATSARPEIISINVNDAYRGYAYAVLAIVSGFSADKVLRSMFDKVLKKLEQEAEKTKDSETEKE